MKLYIKEKVFSWSDKFTVWDELGRDKYYVEGEVFSFGKKLHIYDVAGREVAFIRQRLWSWMPRYEVFRGERQVAEIKQEFTFFRPRFTVYGPDGDIEGSFWEHDYCVTRNGRPIVTISKEWMTWGDSYELNIAEPADEIMALAVIITIDCMQEDRASRNT